VTLERIGFFCFPIKHSTHTVRLRSIVPKRPAAHGLLHSPDRPAHSLSLFARPMERAVTHLCIYVLLCVYIWMHTQTHTRVFRNPYVYVCVWVIECEGVCGGASERERVGMPLGERGVVATGAIF